MRETDHREYADDTILYLDTENSGKMILQLQHYQLLTQTRKLHIQWNKVEMMIRKLNTKLKKELPGTFSKIQYETAVEVLGGMIHINNTTSLECRKRLQIAKNVWRVTMGNS